MFTPQDYLSPLLQNEKISHFDKFHHDGNYENIQREKCFKISEIEIMENNDK